MIKCFSDIGMKKLYIPDLVLFSVECSLPPVCQPTNNSSCCVTFYTVPVTENLLNLTPFFPFNISWAISYLALLLPVQDHISCNAFLGKHIFGTVLLFALIFQVWHHLAFIKAWLWHFHHCIIFCFFYLVLQNLSFEKFLHIWHSLLSWN